jgi:hypothetical protein
LSLDQENRRNRLGQFLMRVVPRLAIILLVFVGLNWWVGKDRQQTLSTATSTTQVDNLWDVSKPRRPGYAVAIVIDEHRPESIDVDVFNAWQRNIRDSLRVYQNSIVRVAGKQNHLPVRVGFFRTSESLTAAQTGMKRELSPPAQSDVDEAMDAGQWHGQQQTLDKLMQQAVVALSDSGLESTMVLVIRYPLLESKESVYQIISRWKPALPASPDGPRIVVDMELLKGEKVSEKDSPLLRSLLRLTFPDLELELPASTGPLSN